MGAENDIHLNGERIRRARLACNLSQRNLARLTHIQIAQLVALEKGGRCDRITLGTLFRLAEGLAVTPASLLQAEEAPPPAPAADDVKLEALLATVGKAANRDDIAWALGWEVDRVNATLEILGARLAGTGQRLRKAKFGWWGLAAAEDILGRAEAANIERATFTEYGINLGHARVLKRLARGEPLRYTHTYASNRGNHASTVGALVRGDVLGVRGSQVLLTEVTAFSLCLEEEVETVPIDAFKPQTRAPRAAYTVNRGYKRRG